MEEQDPPASPAEEQDPPASPAEEQDSEDESAEEGTKCDTCDYDFQLNKDGLLVCDCEGCFYKEGGHPDHFNTCENCREDIYDAISDCACQCVCCGEDGCCEFSPTLYDLKGSKIQVVRMNTWEDPDTHQEFGPFPEGSEEDLYYKKGTKTRGFRLIEEDDNQDD